MVYWPGHVVNVERITTMTRYSLSRNLPNGGVRMWDGAMTVREVGQAIAYCLTDNGVATRQKATSVGMEAERVAKEGGGQVKACGYTFTIVPTIICRKCKSHVNHLEIFPGQLCLPCWRPQGEAEARTMTADDLTAMWGGKRRR